MGKTTNNMDVIIVEDDVILRESIAEYLSLSGITVAEVGSCLECYTILNSRSFSVAVVDVSLPDQSGLIVVEYLRANTETRIIVLTARETVEDRVAGYASGADIYLVKPVDSRELLAAITSLSQRKRSNGDAQPVSLPLVRSWVLDRAAWQLLPPLAPPIPLTSKELTLLELLAATPNVTVTREKLLANLYSRHDEYTSRSLDSMVRRLRRKISSVTAQDSPIKTTHAVGYSFACPILLQ